jgi:hypothetical protein
MQTNVKGVKNRNSKKQEIDLPKKILDVTKTVDELSESILGKEFIKDKNNRIKKKLLKAQGLYIDAKGNKKKISAIYAKGINLKDHSIKNKLIFPNVILRDSITNENLSLSNSDRKNKISLKEFTPQLKSKQEFNIENLEKETTKSTRSHKTDKNFNLVNSVVHEGDDYFYLDDSFTIVGFPTKKSFNKSRYKNLIGLNKTNNICINQTKEENIHSNNVSSNTSNMIYFNNINNLTNVNSPISKNSIKQFQNNLPINETQRISLLEYSSELTRENDNTRIKNNLVLPKKSSLKNIKFINFNSEKEIDDDTNLFKNSNIKSMLNHQRNHENGLLIKNEVTNQGDSFMITSLTTNNTSNRGDKKIPESSKNIIIKDYFTSDDQQNKNFMETKKTKVSSKNINVKFNLDMNIENDVKKELMKTQHISINQNFDFSPEKSKVTFTDHSEIVSLKSKKNRIFNLPVLKLEESQTSFLTTLNTHKNLKSDKNSGKKSNPISLKLNPKSPKKQLNNLINMCEALKVEDQKFYTQLEKELDIINPTIPYRNKIPQQKVLEDDMFRPQNLNKKYFVYGQNEGLFMSDVTSGSNVLEEANVVSRIPPIGVYKFRRAICNRMGLNPKVDPETGEIGLERIGKVDLDEEAKKFDYKFQNNHQKVNKVLDDIEKKHNYLMAAALSNLK